MSLRETALKAIDDTRFVPASGQNRLRDDRGPPGLGGVASARLGRADHGVRRIRTPASRCATKRRSDRRIAALQEEGADAWFASARPGSWSGS